MDTLRVPNGGPFKINTLNYPERPMQPTALEYSPNFDVGLNF